MIRGLGVDRSSGQYLGAFARIARTVEVNVDASFRSAQPLYAAIASTITSTRTAVIFAVELGPPR